MNLMVSAVGSGVSPRQTTYGNNNMTKSLLRCQDLIFKFLYLTLKLKFIKYYGKILG